jgi:hypothetical protein
MLVLSGNIIGTAEQTHACVSGPDDSEIILALTLLCLFIPVRFLDAKLLQPVLQRAESQS